MSRPVKVTAASTLLTVGLGLITVVLAHEGLDRAENWISIASALVSVPCTAAGLFLGWSTWRQGQARSEPTNGSPRTNGLDADQRWHIDNPCGRFFGRESDLERLDAAFTDRSFPAVRVVVIYGPTGVGKSEFARAWAWSHRRSLTPPTGGWWIRATTRLSAIADLAAVAESLGCGDADPGRAADRALEHLRQHGGWLMVFDGVPDLRTVEGLLPSGDGRILVTSRRSPDWDTTAIRLDPFDRQTATTFLQQYVGDGGSGAADLLAEKLGGLPQALALAAMTARSGGGLRAFLRLYLQEGPLRTLTAEASGSRRGVAVTIQATVRQVEREDRAAVELLRLLASLAPSGVPQHLLAAAPTALRGPLRRTVSDPLRLARTVQRLVDAALVTADLDGRLRIHQLVRSIVHPHAPHHRSRWQDRWVPRALRPGSRTPHRPGDPWDRYVASVLLAWLPEHDMAEQSAERERILVPLVEDVLVHQPQLAADDTPGAVEEYVTLRRWLQHRCDRQSDAQSSRAQLSAFCRATATPVPAWRAATDRRVGIATEGYQVGLDALAGLPLLRAELDAATSANGADHPSTIAAQTRHDEALRIVNGLPS